ncbi:MAG: TonB family protein, partial [Candidatus Sulfotelmatobacter sp.]
AIDLQPGDARNLYFHAMLLHLQGHQEQAISEARRAVTLDPLNISVQSALGKIYNFTGHYDEAIAELYRALTMDPDNAEIRGSVGRAYELKGDYPRAIVELQKSRSDPLQSSESVAYLGYIFAREGKLTQASACLEDLHRMSRNPSYDVDPLDFAIVYAGMGNTEKSLAWLHRGYREHSQSLLDIASMPELASLSNDPRFQDLLHRIGLAQTGAPPAAVLPINKPPATLKPETIKAATLKSAHPAIKKPTQITATEPNSPPLSPDQQATTSHVSVESPPARVETRSENNPLPAFAADGPTVLPNVNGGTSPVPVKRAPARIESLFQNIQPDVVRTRVTYAVLPTYPADASQARVTGTVEIGLAVSPNGDVGSARVLIGHPLLIAPALEAIRQWRFQPNQVQGELTWSRMRALVRFRADGTTAVAFAPPLLADSFGDLGTQRDERRDASIPPIVPEAH